MQDDKGGCDMVDLKGRPFYLDEGQIAWVKRTLESMTAEEKAGQLFLVMGQDYAPERLLELTARGRIGGVLFRPEPLQAILDRYRPQATNSSKDCQYSSSLRPHGEQRVF